MGDIRMFMDETYPVTARFTSISGLKEGAVIELAGVKVGKVSAIELDGGDYEAVVHLDISREVMLTDDSIASIRTAGIIGDREVSPDAYESIDEPITLIEMIHTEFPSWRASADPSPG